MGAAGATIEAVSKPGRDTKHKQDIETKSVDEKQDILANKEKDIQKYDKEIEDNPLLSEQTSKPAFVGLPVDDLANSWMHEDIGMMDEEDSEEDSEEDVIREEMNRSLKEKTLKIKENVGEIQNPTENISQHPTGLVDVLKTFLAENDDTAASATTEDASKQVADKKHDETDLQTFLDNEENESDVEDSNSDES